MEVVVLALLAIVQLASAQNPIPGGRNYTGPLCSEFSGLSAITKGDFIPVCIIISNKTHSYRTVFYPAADTFTLLEVDNSWTQPSDWWGELLGNNLAQFMVAIEVDGVRSSYTTVQANSVQIPYWTITIQLDNGVLNPTTPFVWDNDGGSGCFGGCQPSDCLDGFCGSPIVNCGSASTDTDCDLKIYVGWYGTDSTGTYLTSASKRLSAFRSWSVVDVFQAAASVAAANQPNPDALLNAAGDILNG